MDKLIFIFLMLTLLNINAQNKFNDKSYKVTIDDLSTNEFIADSTAKALVIYEEGSSSFNESLSKLSTKIKRKVKIFDKNDSKNTKIEILLFNTDKRRKEKLKNILASTYNLVNNKIIETKLNKNNIYEEKYDDNHTLIKFTFPNVQDGSVITYSYSQESPFFFNFYEWDFQEDIPKLYSEYNTSIPSNYDYNIKLMGNKKFAINESKVKYNCIKSGLLIASNCTETRYAMKNVPAFIKEKYISSQRNYLLSLKYELLESRLFDGSVRKFSKTWNIADKELKTEESIGKQLNKKSLVKNLMNDDPSNIENLFDRAKNIYKYVQSNYTWNGKYQVFNDVSLKETIKNKSGRVSEINLLLFNLLKTYNIKVKPVLLATRKAGLPTKLYPVISEFNYLIVQVEIENKTYLLDATDKYLSFGELPYRCLNYYGRLLDFKNGSTWVNLEPLKNNNILHRLSLKFNDDKLSGTINSKYHGHEASIKKKSYFPRKTKYLEDFKNNNHQIDVINHKVKTNQIEDKLFEEEYTIEYSDFEEVGDRVFINPFLIKFFKENPFKLQERTYPIEFGYTKSFTYMAQFDLGKNYEVVNLPEAFSVGLPNNSGIISFSPSILQNKLLIVFKVTLKLVVFNPKLYNYLKQFFNKIIDTQSKTLIELKKK